MNVYRVLDSNEIPISPKVWTRKNHASAAAGRDARYQRNYTGGYLVTYEIIEISRVKIEKDEENSNNYRTKIKYIEDKAEVEKEIPEIKRISFNEQI